MRYTPHNYFSPSEDAFNEKQNKVYIHGRKLARATDNSTCQRVPIFVRPELGYRKHVQNAGFRHVPLLT